MQDQDIYARLRRVSWLLRARDIEIKARNLTEVVAKANFNPNQPRVPTGNPDGGQWTDAGGGGGASTVIAGAISE